MLEQVLGDKLHWVGGAFLSNLAQGLQEQGHNGLVEVGADGKSLKLLGTAVLLLHCKKYTLLSLSSNERGMHVSLWVSTLVKTLMH